MRERNLTLEILPGVVLMALLALVLMWKFAPVAEHQAPKIDAQLPGQLMEGEPLRATLMATGTPTPLFRCRYAGIELAPNGTLYWQNPPAGQHSILIEAENRAGRSSHTWHVWVERRQRPIKQVRVLPPLEEPEVALVLKEAEEEPIAAAPLPEVEAEAKSEPEVVQVAEAPSEMRAEVEAEPQVEEPVVASVVEAPVIEPAVATPTPVQPNVVIAKADAKLAERGKSVDVTQYDLRARGDLTTFLRSAQAANIKLLLVALRGQSLVHGQIPYTVAVDRHGARLAVRSTWQNLLPQFGESYSHTFFRLAQVPDHGTWHHVEREMRRELGLGESYQVIGFFPYALLGALDEAVQELTMALDQSAGSSPVFRLELTPEGGVRVGRQF